MTAASTLSVDEQNRKEVLTTAHGKANHKWEPAVKHSLGESGRMGTEESPGIHSVSSGGGGGTITVQRPRVRGLEQRFESRVLPLFARRTAEVHRLIPELYLHGLALGDFDLALRGLLGEEAPVSAGTVARLKEGWRDEWEEWKKRPLDGLEVLFMWVDGIYVKAGLEKEKAALLVVVGGLLDGRKVIMAVEPGYRESTESWSGVLRDLKERGLTCPRLVVGDGNLGIWGALRNVYPDASEQRCWNHKIVTCWTSYPRRRSLRRSGDCRR